MLSPIYKFWFDTANLLKSTRGALGRSLAEMAKAADVSADTLSNAEAGIPVSVDSLVKIADAYGLSLSLIPKSSKQEKVVLLRYSNF